MFRDGGCELLGKYTGNHDPVEYRCECGRIAKITLSHFLNGERCKDCGRSRTIIGRYANGNAPSSTQQVWLHKVLGGELNYPVGQLSLDIAFPDSMLYVEYDGSGHDLTVRMGTMTEEEFHQKQLRRDSVLKTLGWKCIRIISTLDYLPSTQTVISMFDFASDVLSKHHFVTFDIDNKMVKYGGVSYPYDFGELYKMEKRRKIKQDGIDSVTTAIPCGDIRDTVGSVA